MLGDIATRCGSYSKALHYRELEYQVRDPPFSHSSPHLPISPSLSRDLPRSPALHGLRRRSLASCCSSTSFSRRHAPHRVSSKPSSRSTVPSDSRRPRSACSRTRSRATGLHTHVPPHPTSSLGDTWQVRPAAAGLYCEALVAREARPMAGRAHVIRARAARRAP